MRCAGGRSEDPDAPGTGSGASRVCCRPPSGSHRRSPFARRTEKPRLRCQQKEQRLRRGDQDVRGLRAMRARSDAGCPRCGSRCGSRGGKARRGGDPFDPDQWRAQVTLHVGGQGAQWRDVQHGAALGGFIGEQGRPAPWERCRGLARAGGETTSVSPPRRWPPTPGSVRRWARRTPD